MRRKRKARGIRPKKKAINEKTSIELGLALKIGLPVTGAAFFLGGLANSVATQPAINKLQTEMQQLQQATHSSSYSPQITANAFIDNASTGTGNTLPLTAQVEPKSP